MTGQGPAEGTPPGLQHRGTCRGLRDPIYGRVQPSPRLSRASRPREQGRELDGPGLGLTCRAGQEALWPWDAGRQVTTHRSQVFHLIMFITFQDFLLFITCFKLFSLSLTFSHIFTLRERFFEGCGDCGVLGGRQPQWEAGGLLGQSGSRSAAAALGAPSPPGPRAAPTAAELPLHCPFQEDREL